MDQFRLLELYKVIEGLKYKIATLKRNRLIMPLWEIANYVRPFVYIQNAFLPFLMVLVVIPGELYEKTNKEIYSF